MELKNLISKVILKLKEANRDDLVRLVSYVDSEKDLRSFLREHIFHKDSEVLEFVNEIKDKEKEKIPAKESLTEVELTDIVFNNLTAFFEKKNSKFKMTKHWRTMDKDLCFCIEDAHKNESEYRLIILRT